jgi:prohibitin 1
MTNIRFKTLVAILMMVTLIQSCAIIRPGEIGFKQKLGKIKGESFSQGIQFYNPFITRVIKMNVRTIEVFNNLPLPTKEGLSVNAEISLLYHVNQNSAISVYNQFGLNYQNVMVLSNFWATAREISARFYAKELYATERTKVEKAILEELSAHISQYGFIVDAVLLKDIILPKQMVHAIEDKVTAEQSALQMEFVIEKQKRESERLVIEAEGIKKSQQIINQSLTEKLIQFEQIQMLKSLVNSPNSKIIITDGKAPLIIGSQSDTRN